MATVGNLFVNVGARTEQFVSGIAKARAALNRFGEGLLTAKVLGFGSAITAAAVALGSVYLHRQAEAIDATYKLGRSLGVTTEQMGGLTYAADLAGTSSDQLATAMRRMMRLVGDAAGGSQQAVDSLGKLGLTLDEVQGLSADQLFLRVADSIGAMEGPAQQASAAVALFGKSGAELIPLLTSGGDEIRRLSQEAIDLGKAIGGPAAAQVEAANDALTRMKAIVEAAANAVLVELSPYIVRLADDLVTAAKEAGGFGAIVRDAFGWAIPVASFLSDVVRSVKIAFDGLRASVLTFASAFTLVAANFWTGVDYMTLGLTGLANGSKELRDISADLWKQAGEARSAAMDGLDGLATDPIEQFAQRAEQTRIKISQLADAADKAKPAIEGLGDATATELAEAQAQAIANADKLAHRLYEQARTYGMASREAEIYLAQISGAEDTQIEYLRRVDEWLTKKEAEADATKKAADAAAQATQQHHSLVDSLEEQAATFGYSAAMVDQYRASMRGAGDEQLQQIQTLHDLIDAKQREADLFEEGRRVIEDVMTPQEQYEKQLERLRTLLEAGAIDPATYSRAQAKAAESLAPTGGVSIERPTSIGVETAIGTIKVPGITEAAGVQDRMLSEAERQTELLREIAGAGDRTGGTRTLDGAMPSGLTRVIDEAAVTELKRANEALSRIAKNTAGLAGALT